MVQFKLVRYRLGNKVKLAPNSLTFTCTLDGNTAQKSYPRSTGANTTSGADYAYDKWPELWQLVKIQLLLT
ncbi:MAG: hypothetical protein CM15mV10_0010 [uncultured marine virus]|nr:MAG: hypothetical protein CM15mV10_0010 [uncultured marine virus]